MQEMLLQPHETCFTPVFVARQPVFDARMKIWGYELLYRDHETATAAAISDNHLATLNVLANATDGQFLDMRQGRKLLINFTSRCLQVELPLVLPPENSVVQITEETRANSPELQRMMTELKGQAYTLALDDLDEFDSPEALLPLVDMVIIDVLDKSDADLSFVLQRLARFKGDRLAKRVEDRESFSRAKKLGFTLFQGFFFQRPEIIRGRRLSSAQKARFQILRLAEETEPRIDEVSQIIQSDVSLSYRLLAYLNSAAFSLPSKVQSIRHAVMLLGWRQMRHWLRLVVLTDISGKGADSELSFTAAQRGKFLELMAGAHPQLNQDPESMFMLGLLSLLEAMLGIPMAEVLEELPLAPEIRDVLIDPEHGKRTWLALPICFERGDWDGLDTLMDNLGLDPLLVANSYYDSLNWANEFFDLSL